MKIGAKEKGSEALEFGSSFPSTSLATKMSFQLSLLSAATARAILGKKKVGLEHVLQVPKVQPMVNESRCSFGGNPGKGGVM
jgi:hypothetical protein